MFYTPWCFIIRSSPTVCVITDLSSREKSLILALLCFIPRLKERLKSPLFTQPPPWLCSVLGGASKRETLNYIRRSKLEEVKVKSGLTSEETVKSIEESQWKAGWETGYVRQELSEDWQEEVNHECRCGLPLTLHWTVASDTPQPPSVHLPVAEYQTAVTPHPWQPFPS